MGLRILLSSYLKLKTATLEVALETEKLLFLNTRADVDLDIFETQYTQIQNILGSKLSVEDTIITVEMNTKFQRIWLEYYSKLGIYGQDILNMKKFYIASMFSNKININLKQAIAEISKIEKIMLKYNDSYTTKMNTLDKIIEKYTLAYKQYQTKIVENITIPLFIFSGKIIQNYPLGLGIIIKTATNAVEFKSGDMETDIFNNLSTGQLNGVMISVLLSVKEIFASESSFNTLLIDDPLQSIDDISAISFIDLISEHFQNTQIILSTHEDDKVNLLQHKYKSCAVFNMQERYLQ